MFSMSCSMAALFGGSIKGSITGQSVPLNLACLGVVRNNSI